MFNNYQHFHIFHSCGIFREDGGKTPHLFVERLSILKCLKATQRNLGQINMTLQIWRLLTITFYSPTILHIILTIINETMKMTSWHHLSIYLFFHSTTLILTVTYWISYTYLRTLYIAMINWSIIVIYFFNLKSRSYDTFRRKNKI